MVPTPRRTTLMRDAGMYSSDGTATVQNGPNLIVSVHHYVLAESTTEEEFHETVREAERRGLFELPGLIEFRFLQGIK